MDVSGSMAVVMAVKEDSEVKTIQKACQVTCDVFSKYLKEQIMEVIDSDKVWESIGYFLKDSTKCLFSRFNDFIDISFK